MNIKRKPNLFEVIRLWGVSFLLILAFIILGLLTFSSLQETKNRSAQMRADYIKQQQQLIKTEVDRVVNVINYESNQQLQSTRNKVKARSLEAHAVAQNLYEQLKSKMPEAEIKKIIIEALRPIRFDQGRGYYFINGFDGVPALLPDTPHREGISMLDSPDAEVRNTVKSLITIARSKGEGFHTYRWAKPDSPETNFQKVSFVKLFEPYNWFIGTGAYLDKIETEIQKTLLTHITTHRFGPNNSGYVFINELHNIQGGKNFATVYANPNRPEDRGKSLSDDFQDANGKMFRKEFLKGLRKDGECFVDYWYRKIDTSEPSPKTSFFKLAGDARFIVAAGVYLDDIEEQIALMQADLTAQLTKASLTIGAVFITIIFGFIFLLNRLSRKLADDFQLFANFFKKATYTSEQIDRTQVKFNEFDQLADFANTMLRMKSDFEEELKLTAKVFENTNEGIIVTDAEANIIATNNAFTTITGYEQAEALGQNPRILQSGRQSQVFYQAMWQQISAQGHWRGEIWNKRKNGEHYPQSLTISVVTDDQDKPCNYVAVFADITESKEAIEKLSHLAHHHPLTQLPNRLLLHGRLNHSIQKAQRDGHQGAVIFIDLDNFKNINDSLGHSAGDEVLLEVARRLNENHREVDTIAHLSGDEFVIVLDNIQSIHSAAKKADQILEKLNSSLQIHGYEVSLSGSLGITLFPDDGNSSETLLKNADTAMYKAKKSGKNQYHIYSETLTAEALERLSLEGALRHAVENEELVLHYQPQIDLATQELVACEALVRWQHPELGLIPPDKFIPLSEETGVIIPLGEWVLETACRQFVAWRQLGYGLKKIAVNVSGRQIQHHALAPLVQQILEKTGCPAACLELEITEGFVMQNPEHSIATLQQLRDLGVALSVDDFGTGHSSLNYLKRLPVSRLKIDRSFVRDIHQDSDDEAIIKAILALGQSLGLQITAEGIETEEQLRFLADLACDEGQGFLISKPLPADLFERYMRDR